MGEFHVMLYKRIINYHKDSTKDDDNDQWGGNCAGTRGAWWYKSCYHSNLNDLLVLILLMALYGIIGKVQHENTSYLTKYVFTIICFINNILFILCYVYIMYTGGLQLTN